jgi:hypothetical protein
MTAYHRIIDALQANGRRVIEHGGGKAQAQCPAHDDHNPSLSIWPREDRKGVLVKCHAGCDLLDVLAGIGLITRDLFDDPQMRRVYGDRATYVYPGGRQVHRKPGKAFPQSGNKGDHSLFHAERIGDACLVHVPEGERDVLAIEALGGTAVCSAMGAGKAHLADWSPLAGLDVIVIADKDNPGRGHARDIVSLLTGKAQSVRIVAAAVGKDAADHIAAGLGLHEFVPVDDTAPRNGAELGDDFVTVTLSAVTPERVTWLWQDRLPAGKLVTLDGDPGLGKSTLALTFAAVITTGGQWPDGTRCEHPGDVVLLSAEDGIADTIRPRADAAGANIDRIHAVQGVPIPGEDAALRLPTLADIAQLRRLVDATHARLVIVDVLMAYLPVSTDSHKDQDIRAVLARLAALADATGATVLLLRHLNKGKGGDPLYRGGGSIGIVGAARAAMLVAADPDDEDMRVLAWLKNNLAPMPASLNYRLIPDELRDVARVQWLGASDRCPRDLLSGDDGGGAAEAEQWLIDYLDQEGSAPSKDVKAAAWKDARIPERTLQRAANKLRVVFESKGFPRSTWWTHPSTVAPPPNGATEGGTTANGPGPAETSEPNASRAMAPRDCATEPKFIPPSGPGRCDECGFHTETQGHRDTCSKQPDFEPPF